ncbi:MAG TPA: type II toxin-antitoxin system prevent-host-death family antitoxin [Candidatus Limnocylindrales bacterium]|nr:type II toxin-antitoxin system prevent-host-death family antitoxin [Candidatus Limnocylindrales bacterium]
MTKPNFIMPRVNIHEAKTRLSRLVDLAASGEEVVIAKSGKPVARLISYTPKGAVRRSGGMCGKIRIKKDFDAPLPKELLKAFEEKL